MHLDAQQHPPKAPAALPADAPGLLQELGSGNLTRRTLALNEICDRIGRSAIPLLQAAAAARPLNALQKINVVWALHRLGALDDDLLAYLLAYLLAKTPTKWSPPSSSW